MKNLCLFSLRKFFLAVIIVSTLVGAFTVWVNRCIAQRRNVEKLENLGDTFHTRDGIFCGVQVWYDNDLRWDDETGTYQITLKKFLGEGRISGWIDRNLGRDFVHFPVAIEFISVKPSFESDLDQILRQLPTVRQIWIDENQFAKGSNDKMRAKFPALIIARPQ